MPDDLKALESAVRAGRGELQCWRALDGRLREGELNPSTNRHSSLIVESQLNPQREIPVLDDNGFLLSEHIAIMQYICDKYAPDSKAYPKDPTIRALINHRLCFNMAHFYNAIAPYTLAPIFFEVIACSSLPLIFI